MPFARFPYWYKTDDLWISSFCLFFAFLFCCFCYRRIGGGDAHLQLTWEVCTPRTHISALVFFTTLYSTALPHCRRE
ncbi:hypothetical protein BJX64DRAFT_168857 [Aspergillus heterothallicus]